MKKLLHKLSHLFGTNSGVVECFYKDDILMVGYRCECGELMDVDKAYLPDIKSKGADK